MLSPQSRRENEIEHGKQLVKLGPESVWGWGTPAGVLRAGDRARRIANGVSLGPGMQVLEVGCGTGVFTEFFARTHATITAMDISANLVRIARSKPYRNHTIRFVIDDFERFTPPRRYDAIIGVSVLHHLDISRSLRQIFRLLKPGGRMCFSEPNLMNPQIFLQKSIPRLKQILGDSPDETALLRIPLKRLLRREGFVIHDLYPFDWLHPLTPETLIPKMRRFSRALERCPLIREFAGSLFINCSKPTMASAD
jgi:SAM-dependent methyltransferase